ncbi:hypothetical protein BB934_45200 (plasmid) [Microvirga ossetica]|uniref:Uncharacterized protein n=1 Tax=Microvirga ossetica TaxID=1882682 RepID=A0A1B2EZJ3_9HYPH|nr:hypothetical protein [Microvirga ossetica]ANY85419.1 hypothetical protein BB934_45200 [Microvirga ossetica]
MERKIEVGTRFTRRDSRPWRDGDKKGTEVTVSVCEVTAIHDGRFDYRVVEVLSVEDAPSFYKPSDGGGISLRGNGLAWLVSKGVVTFE